MPTLEPNTVENLGKCLSGTADFSACPHSGYQTAESWLDGLMQSQMTMDLLTSPPCSVSKADADQVQTVLNTIATFTYDTGSGKAPFWARVVSLFAERSAARKTAARSLAKTSAQLARDNPDLSTDEIAAMAELEELLKALNGGY